MVNRFDILERQNKFNSPDCSGKLPHFFAGLIAESGNNAEQKDSFVLQNITKCHSPKKSAFFHKFSEYYNHLIVDFAFNMLGVITYKFDFFDNRTFRSGKICAFYI